jgi:hypothetical protein
VRRTAECEKCVIVSRNYPYLQAKSRPGSGVGLFFSAAGRPRIFALDLGGIMKLLPQLIGSRFRVQGSTALIVTKSKFSFDTWWLMFFNPGL